MQINERTERALEACYDAILAPERWGAALDGLAHALGAAGCLFHPHSPTTLRFPLSAGLAELGEMWSRDEVNEIEVHSKRAPRLVCGGRSVIIEDDISTPEERSRSAYYQEVLRPCGLTWWASLCFEVESQYWCLPMFRAERHGPFTVREATNLAAVAPHLRRIVGLAERLAAADVGGGVSALERLGTAAMLLDWRGLVERLNRQAEALLGTDLRCIRHRLSVADPASDRRLRNLIAGALDFRTAGNGHTLDPVMIERDGAPWLVIEAMPISAFGTELFGAFGTILIITDLSRPIVPRERVLRLAFGLTPAEARLAAEIAGGDGVDAAAMTLGIARETARSQLKAVFSKTNTASQAQLIALIARIGGTLA